MDTRFWGPSGWKLLHTVAFLYEPAAADATAEWLATLPYVLPCKFCRASLTDYYRAHPYGGADVLRTRESFSRWMYKIHNCVNAKLREQGLNPSPDPPYKAVKGFYGKWLKRGLVGCVTQTFWDFLFAVAYNHPKEAGRKSVPMPNCPVEATHCHDPAERNKWNVMTAAERMPYYRRFWELIPAVLPVFSWREGPGAELSCRRSTVAWLWRQRCRLQPDAHDPYREVCARVAAHASGCSASRRAKTCRKQGMATLIKKRRPTAGTTTRKRRAII